MGFLDLPVALARFAITKAFYGGVNYFLNGKERLYEARAKYLLASNQVNLDELRRVERMLGLYPHVPVRRTAVVDHSAPFFDISMRRFHPGSLLVKSGRATMTEGEDYIWHWVSRKQARIDFTNAGEFYVVSAEWVEWEWQTPETISSPM